MLARREHSFVELRNKLVLRGFSVVDITRVLDDLRDAGLQSDMRYASMVARVRYSKGYGPVYIRSYLQQRGVSDDLISDILYDYDDIWLDSLTGVIKKYGDTSGGPNCLKWQRCFRFLLARGFTVCLIRSAMGGS